MCDNKFYGGNYDKDTTNNCFPIILKLGYVYTTCIRKVIRINFVPNYKSSHFTGRLSCEGEYFLHLQRIVRNILQFSLRNRFHRHMQFSD